MMKAIYKLRVRFWMYRLYRRLKHPHRVAIRKAMKC